MSCTCQECERQYKVDIIIPDELWEGKIKPKEKPQGSGMLCGECIMKKLEEFNEYNAYELKYKKNKFFGLHWFTKKYWQYLLEPKNWVQKSYKIKWITIIICRIKEHKNKGYEYGVVWYNAGGLEPDMHCRNCYSDLG
jgi:hypothetical protein